MPTLEFKGKPFVYSHHLSVPFRELRIDGDKSLPDAGGPSLDDNLIIHGDNLEALRALLPRYAGKVNVIYIDPPYNTGKDDWRYNDRVSSPLMESWPGSIVNKEDMERHDKWLCMMWPRLQLLRELLVAHGVMFVSIDDNEVDSLSARLRMGHGVLGAPVQASSDVALQASQRCNPRMPEQRSGAGLYYRAALTHSQTGTNTFSA